MLPAQAKTSPLTQLALKQSETKEHELFYFRFLARFLWEWLAQLELRLTRKHIPL